MANIYHLVEFSKMLLELLSLIKTRVYMWLYIHLHIYEYICVYMIVHI